MRHRQRGVGGSDRIFGETITRVQGGTFHPPVVQQAVTTLRPSMHQLHLCQQQRKSLEEVFGREGADNILSETINQYRADAFYSNAWANFPW